MTLLLTCHMQQLPLLDSPHEGVSMLNNGLPGSKYLPVKTRPTGPSSGEPVSRWFKILICFMPNGRGFPCSSLGIPDSIEASNHFEPIFDQIPIMKNGFPHKLKLSRHFEGSRHFKCVAAPPMDPCQVLLAREAPTRDPSPFPRRCRSLRQVTMSAAGFRQAPGKSRQYVLGCGSQMGTQGNLVNGNKD